MTSQRNENAGKHSSARSYSGLSFSGYNDFGVNTLSDQEAEVEPRREFLSLAQLEAWGAREKRKGEKDLALHYTLRTNDARGYLSVSTDLF